MRRERAAAWFKGDGLGRRALSSRSSAAGERILLNGLVCAFSRPARRTDRGAHYRDAGLRAN
jgi:hypothetical protein